MCNENKRLYCDVSVRYSHFSRIYLRIRINRAKILQNIQQYFLLKNQLEPYRARGEGFRTCQREKEQTSEVPEPVSHYLENLLNLKRHNLTTVQNSI